MLLSVLLLSGPVPLALPIMIVGFLAVVGLAAAAGFIVARRMPRAEAETKVTVIQRETVRTKRRSSESSNTTNLERRERDRARRQHRRREILGRRSREQARTEAPSGYFGAEEAPYLAAEANVAPISIVRTARGPEGKTLLGRRLGMVRAGNPTPQPEPPRKAKMMISAPASRPAVMQGLPAPRATAHLAPESPYGDNEGPHQHSGSMRRLTVKPTETGNYEPAKSRIDQAAAAIAAAPHMYGAATQHGLDPAHLAHSPGDEFEPLSSGDAGDGRDDGNGDGYTNDHQAYAAEQTSSALSARGYDHNDHRSRHDAAGAAHQPQDRYASSVEHASSNEQYGYEQAEDVERVATGLNDGDEQDWNAAGAGHRSNQRRHHDAAFDQQYAGPYEGDGDDMNEVEPGSLIEDDGEPMRYADGNGGYYSDDETSGYRDQMVTETYSEEPVNHAPRMVRLSSAQTVDPDPAAGDDQMPRGTAARPAAFGRRSG